MSIRDSAALQEWIDAVQEQAAELRVTTEQAREETRDEVSARIEQVRADLAAQRQSARDKAGHAASRAQGQWESMRADVAAKMQDLHARITRMRDEQDVKKAGHRAELAEADAEEALDFARWAVSEAQLYVLDAIDARAWADERAADFQAR